MQFSVGKREHLAVNATGGVYAKLCRLYVMDRDTKLQFLEDTCVDLFVFAGSRVGGRSSPTKYKFFAVNSDNNFRRRLIMD